MAKRNRESKSGNDDNHASVRFWMFAQIICLIPVIGWVMTVVWAFTGQNQSRKNYFRAVLVWWLVLIAFFIGGFLFGIWPTLRSTYEQVLKAITT